MAAAAVLGFLWFASSAVLSTYSNTKFLLVFDSPLAHTVVRFGCSFLLGLVTLALQPKQQQRSLQETIQVMWGLRRQAAFLFIANHLNSMALQLSGNTLCYVCKAGIPVFTIMVMILEGHVVEPILFLSLTPAVLGVAIASVSDLDFSAGGLAAALGSAFAQTLLNVTSKHRMHQLKVNGQDGQFFMACWCFCAAIPLYALEPHENSAGNVFAQAMLTPQGLGVMLLTGVAYHLEYVLNFMFVPYVSSLAFSVTDVARRLTKIILGALFFHTALTVSNFTGVVMSLGGVLWFSYLQYTLKESTSKVVSTRIR